MKEIVNRKAKFEFQFLQEFEAGIVLTGTEVKSIKMGNANLSDAYCHFDNDGKLVIKSMYIAIYEQGNLHNHETRRDRFLLLRKSELHKISRRITEKGMTLVPYKIYLSDRGIIKLQVQLSQGKKAFDKRDSLREKDQKRDLERIKKIKL